jgi:hypothetical protein
MYNITYNGDEIENGLGCLCRGKKHMGLWTMVVCLLNTKMETGLIFKEI